MRIARCGVILLLAAGLVCAQKKNALEISNAKALNLVGKAVPDFTVSALDRDSLHITDERGRTVVLAFWPHGVRPAARSCRCSPSSKRSLRRSPWRLCRWRSTIRPK